MDGWMNVWMCGCVDVGGSRYLVDEMSGSPLINYFADEEDEWTSHLRS
jgi:hypothetical protein